MKNFGVKEIGLALVIVALTGGIIGYKVFVLDYSMTTIEPEDGYYVRLMMNVTGNGNAFKLGVTLPLQSDRQRIKSERESSGGVFRFGITPSRVGRWRAAALSGEHSITYSFFAQTEERTYALPENQPIPESYSKQLREYLGATDRIQSDSALIREKAFELAPEGADLQSALTAIYNFCYSEVKYLKIRGPTDAVTALKLGEASCNGKNRLMVALLRARGIPARMTNGLILENNRKRTTHAWTIARVGDEWVPFCPTNGYFARIPEHYLELARGDIAVFTHSKHVGFDWRFVIQRQLSHREQAVLSNASNPLNILHLWTSLKDYHIPLDLIMIILLIPVGATVVALARNVIGLLPFGTFMPALVAVSFRDTGFLFGAVFFLVVIVVGSSANYLLMKLRLLHIPRLVIIITVVVMALMILSIVCIRLGLTTGAAVSLFPMAILSLTCERFTQSMLQEGWLPAARRMVATFTVAGGCYAVYSLEWLQNIIVAFPELLLINIAINLVLGSWTGVRLMEHYRFRDLKRASELA